MTTDFSRVFTLEVGGRPTLAFEARRTREAMELCKESWLREDLSSLKSNGVALWDGNAVLTVRAANDSEAIVYGDAAAAAEPSDDLVLAYLVELDAPG